MEKNFAEANEKSFNLVAIPDERMDAIKKDREIYRTGVGKTYTGKKPENIASEILKRNESQNC